MKSIFKRIRIVNGRLLTALVCLGLLVGIESCIDSIGTVSEPASADAGSTITLSFPVKISNEAFGPTTDKLIVAFLVPKSWNAGKTGNTTVKYTSDLQNGNGNMIPVPATTIVPNNSYPGLSYGDFFKTLYGAGNNVVDDHEWIAFQTDKQFTLNSGQNVTPTITITTKVGTQNMLTKFGFAVTYGSAGADVGGKDSKVFLDNNCFAVVNGTNPLLDFCNKPLTSVLPLSSSDKDFITITYDNDLQTTALQGSTDIYLSAKATTTDNTVIDYTRKITPFVALGEQQYQLIMYPRAYFNLTATQTLDHISYYITNKDGSKVVTGPESQPFNYNFTNCK